MPRGKKRDEEEALKLVQTLKPVLQRGTSLKNACAFSKIAYRSMLNYIKKYERVCTEIDTAKNFLDILAETQIADSIKKGNTNDAKWRLERSQKEKYGTKQGDVNVNVSNEVIIPSELLTKEIQDEFESKQVDNKSSS